MNVTWIIGLSGAGKTTFGERGCSEQKFESLSKTKKIMHDSSSLLGQTHDYKG